MKTFSKNKILAMLFIFCIGAALAIAALLLMRSREAQRLAQLNARYELLAPKILCLKSLVCIASTLTGMRTMVVIVKTNMHPFLSNKSLQEYLEKGFGVSVPGYEVVISRKSNAEECCLANFLEKDKLNRYCAIIDSLIKRVMRNIRKVAPEMYQIALGLNCHDSSVSIDEEIDSTPAEGLIEEISSHMTEQINDTGKGKESIELRGTNNVMRLIAQSEKDIIEIVDHPDGVKSQLDLISGAPGPESYSSGNQELTVEDSSKIK